MNEFYSFLFLFQLQIFGVGSWTHPIVSTPLFSPVFRKKDRGKNNLKKIKKNSTPLPCLSRVTCRLRRRVTVRISFCFGTLDFFLLVTCPLRKRRVTVRTVWGQTQNSSLWLYIYTHVCKDNVFLCVFQRIMCSYVFLWVFLRRNNKFFPVIMYLGTHVWEMFLCFCLLGTHIEHT